MSHFFLHLSLETKERREAAASALFLINYLYSAIANRQDEATGLKNLNRIFNF
jgi:hypothetical protein